MIIEILSNNLKEAATLLHLNSRKIKVKTSKFDRTPDDIRLEKILRFVEWHGPRKVRKKMLKKPVRP